MWACCRKDRRAAYLLVPVVLGLGGVICAQRLVWDRWVVPLIPLMAILAAALLMALAHAVGRRLRGSGARVVGGLVMALGLVGAVVPMSLADMAQARGRKNDTRQRASVWATAHIPAGATVMIEHFGFDLYPRPWRILFPVGLAGCVDARALLRGGAEYKAIDTARAGHSNIDYGTLPADRRASCHADFAIITQFDRYAAEANAFPQEYGAYVELLSRGRVVASFFPDSGYSAGPVVRIVDFRRPAASSVEFIGKHG